MLAMLYLVLFSTLALGFYASVTSATQISHNDHRMTACRTAAESGMQFLKYQLGTVNIPATTPDNQLFSQVYAQLCTKLNGYPTMAGQTVGLSAAGDVISIPGNNGWITCDDTGGRFRATIENMGGTKLRVLVRSRYGNVTGSVGVRLEYAVAQNASSIFDFGIASRSPIEMFSNATVSGGANPALGSVLTTSTRQPALHMDSNAAITGDVTFTNPSAQLIMSGTNTIGGYTKGSASINQHLHYGEAEPEFPVVNTDAFKPFAGNLLNGGTIVLLPGLTYDTGTIRNVLVKANTNPKFAGNLKIQGVVYIETPNKVQFDSNVEITGAIVVQNNPTGDTTTNEIYLESNVKLLPMEALPDNSYFPPALRKLTGASILAPKFNLELDSNFGATAGTIVAGKIHFDSNASGAIKGSVINLEDTRVRMDSTASVTIQSRGTANYPAGVRFGSHFAPLPDTYLEVKQ
jgi:hypothetical protein